MSLEKPARGSGLLARRDRRRERVDAEQAEMRLARQRDQNRCRIPACEFARRKDIPIDVCHEHGWHRGSGGNPDLSRTTTAHLFTGCRIHHGLYDAHEIAAQPLTSDGFDGPVCWSRRNRQTGTLEPMVSEQLMRVSETRSR